MAATTQDAASGGKTPKTIYITQETVKWYERKECLAQIGQGLKYGLLFVVIASLLGTAAYVALTDTTFASLWETHLRHTPIGKLIAFHVTEASEKLWLYFGYLMLIPVVIIARQVARDNTR